MLFVFIIKFTLFLSSIDSLILYDSNFFAYFAELVQRHIQLFASVGGNKGTADQTAVWRYCGRDYGIDENSLIAETTPHPECGHHIAYVQRNYGCTARACVVAHGFEFFHHIVCVFPELRLVDISL